MREDRDYHNSGCVNLSTLLLVVLALPAAVRAWSADRWDHSPGAAHVLPDIMCTDPVHCPVPVRSTSVDSVSRETCALDGGCTIAWHCSACGPALGCAHCDVPVRSQNVLRSGDASAAAVFPAAGGVGHPALSRVPLPVDPVGHGS